MATIVAPPWEEQPTAGGGVTEEQVSALIAVHSTDVNAHPDKLPDAPSDGKIYGRKDAAWAEVTSGGGGGATTVLWANRPAASAAPGGEIIVSDLGYAKFYSDGTNWRPVGGRLRLRSNRGSVATPVASLTDSGVIALPGGNITIPAGLLTRDATISYYMDALASNTSTSTASVSFDIKIGTSTTATTNNTASSVSHNSISSSTGGQFAISGCVNLNTTTKATARTYAGDGVMLSVNKLAGTSALTIKDITTNFNSASVMYIGIALYAYADVTGSVVTFDVFVEM